MALALVAGACLSLLPAAHAQYAGCYGGYCPPQTYAKSYGGYSGQRYYNTKSAWVYRPWPQDAGYFYHYYTVYDHCGNWVNHDDGWLYTYHAGCYTKHCRISEYAGKPSLQPSPYTDPRGSTEVGYYGPDYQAAQKYPLLLIPGVLAQKNLPGTIDPRDILAPFTPTDQARQQFAERSHASATELALKIAQGEQAKELEQIRGRNALAREIQAHQNDERFLAEIKEFFAVRRQQATIDAGAVGASRSVINVGNPKLAELINARCISCHGPGKADGGLNFAEVTASNRAVWQKSYRKCATGEMPKGGEPLKNDELDLFDEQYQFALKSSG
jgi:hypothetical protein